LPLILAAIESSRACLPPAPSRDMISRARQYGPREAAVQSQILDPEGVRVPGTRLLRKRARCDA